MDSTQGTVATRISNQLNSVRGLKSHLEGIQQYVPSHLASSRNRSKKSWARSQMWVQGV